jgi:hypothetical protein
MFNQIMEFKNYPASVKNAILFLLAGWICHYYFYFSFLVNEFPMRTTYMQIGIGVAICFFVVSVKRWARMLCIFFNIGIAALYLLYCAAFFNSGNLNLTFLTGITLILFSISTYFLAVKESSQFFKTYMSNDQKNGNSN